MDLNLVIEKHCRRDSNDVVFDKIRTALKLGFTKIALNVQINDNQIANPPKAPQIEFKQSANFQLFTRVTVVLEDVSKIHKLTQSTILKEYDLLAIEPVNEKALSQLCGGHLECDIITFSLQQKLTFSLKKANFAVPQSKGTCFEINYRQLLLDSTSRQNTIAASQAILERLRGKNVLLSSGAESSIELRGPFDVANLGLLLELDDHKAKHAVFRNGMKAIKHSQLRKNITSQAVVVETELSNSDKWLIEELNPSNDKESTNEPLTKKAKTM